MSGEKVFRKFEKQNISEIPNLVLRLQIHSFTIQVFITVQLAMVTGMEVQGVWDEKKQRKSILEIPDLNLTN